MLIDKLYRSNNFTEGEKTIADFILKHPNEFQKMSCKEVGDVTYTSKSSVVRLCKKLSVSGYQELKRVLYSEYNERRILGGSDIQPTLSETSTYTDIINLLPQVYKQALQEFELSNNENTMKRIMNRIVKMEKVDFYSTGLGYFLLETVSHKFYSIGMESMVSSSINERYLIANKKMNKTIAFVVTFSGNNPLVTHMAEFLKYSGIYVVGVVGPLADEISQYCDELIYIPEKCLIEGTEMVAAYHSINYIFDIFFTKLLSIQYKEIVERQKKINIDYGKNVWYDTKVSKRELK